MSVAVDFDNFRKGLVPSRADNFGALLFLLIAKADLDNRERLRKGFPEHVQKYEEYMGSPRPADEA